MSSRIFVAIFIDINFKLWNEYWKNVYYKTYTEKKKHWKSNKLSKPNQLNSRVSVAVFINNSNIKL